MHRMVPEDKWDLLRIFLGKCHVKSARERKNRQRIFHPTFTRAVLRLYGVERRA